MPLISIIVPVYNAEGSIATCIESILRQTFTDVEVLLIDDGSSDFSGTICQDYAYSDSRVCVFHQENKGVVYARELGIEKAKSDYLFFLDADDTFYNENALEVLYDRMTETQADLVTGDFRKVYKDGKTEIVHRFGDRELYPNLDALDFMFRYYPNFFLWGILYRKALFTGIHLSRNYLIAEDQILLTSVLLKARNMVYIATPIVNYIQSPTSVTNVPTLKKCTDFFDATCEVEKRICEAGVAAQLSFSLPFFLLSHLRLCFRFFESAGIYRAQEIRERIRKYSRTKAMEYIKENDPLFYKQLMAFSKGRWRYRLCQLEEKFKNISRKR